MKILHYSLGFPPYARGGLAKYAMDLMEEEAAAGNEVAMLWPGALRLCNSYPYIKRRGDNTGLKSFELINGLPLPQIYGIKEFNRYDVAADGSHLVSFLKEYRPDIIHFHTLMGLPPVFLEAAKQLNIATVYTTHDFFGICPRTTLFYQGHSCRFNTACEDCLECNAKALDYKKQVLLQSRIYRSIKETGIVKKIRKLKKERIFLAEEAKGRGNTVRKKKKGREGNSTVESESREQYRKLRSHYIAMLEKIEALHFNSRYMLETFSNFFPVKKGKVISISHRDIGDHREAAAGKQLDSTKIRLGYLGAVAGYKGFYVLLEALDSLYESGVRNFELTIYSGISLEREYLIKKPPYEYRQLPEVMNSMDLLAVPNEVSFGFTVLEGLSYGVPVLVGEYVGARDLIEDGKNGVICPCLKEAFQNVLKQLLSDTGNIAGMAENIQREQEIKTMPVHTAEMLHFYRSLGGRKNG